MEITKEMQEEIESNYRKLYPLPSEERSKEILEASKSVTLDDYNPDARWSFPDGQCPWGWYDAQVAAMNHYGHIFCIDPFYGNFAKYKFNGTRLGPDDQKRYGWEYESTEKMLDSLKGTKWFDMTIATIKYLRTNCGVEFPNNWGDQFLPPATK